MKKNKLTSTLRLTLMLSVLFVIGCSNNKDINIQNLEVCQKICNDQNFPYAELLTIEQNNQVNHSCICSKTDEGFNAIVDWQLTIEQNNQVNHSCICSKTDEGFNAIVDWQNTQSSNVTNVTFYFEKTKSQVEQDSE